MQQVTHIKVTDMTPFRETVKVKIGDGLANSHDNPSRPDSGRPLTATTEIPLQIYVFTEPTMSFTHKLYANKDVIDYDYDDQPFLTEER